MLLRKTLEISAKLHTAGAMDAIGAARATALSAAISDVLERSMALKRAREDLMARAIARYGRDIRPCARQSWETSYAIDGDWLCLWYNSPDDSSRMEVAKITDIGNYSGNFTDSSKTV